MSPKSGSNAKPKTPQSPALQHLTAGAKVEIMSDDEGFRGSFFSGTVIRRASSKTPNKYLVEYECLFTDDSGTKPLREIVDTVQIRPLPPPEKKRRTFKFGDEVDACHNDGWWEGVVTEEAEDGKFGVFFRSTREQLVFGEESLRVHREWVDGTWKPPLEEEEEEEEEEEKEEEEEEEEEEEKEEEEEASIEDVSIATKAKPSKEMERGNVDSKKKTKKTKSSAEAKPSKGKDLDNGEPKKETKKTKSSSEGKTSKVKELENVEPKTEARRTRSSKAVKPESAEPKKEPKKSKSSKATKLEDVEPEKEPKKSKTSKATKLKNVQPEKEPKKSKPTKATNLEDVELDKEPETTDMELNDVVMEEKFPNGMQVEVTSDEDGFKGAWFVGTIVEPVGKDKYLVQYENLRTEDDTDFEKEEFYILKIRPRPPELHVVDRFKLLEEVDALYNDAWWVGIIVKVLSSKYVVYFKDTQEELHFKHSDLRPHQDWVDGKWVVPSKALDL